MPRGQHPLPRLRRNSSSSRSHVRCFTANQTATLIQGTILSDAKTRHNWHLPSLRPIPPAAPITAPVGHHAELQSTAWLGWSDGRPRSVVGRSVRNRAGCVVAAERNRRLDWGGVDVRILSTRSICLTVLKAACIAHLACVMERSKVAAVEKNLLSPCLSVLP